MKLKKGEMPRSAKIKQEKNLSSIRSCHQLLMSSIKSPKKTPPPLLSACRSQNGLASLHLPEHNIFPMSLTTFKKNGNLLFGTEGWQHLNQLRKQLNNLTNENSCTKDSLRPNRGTAARRDLAIKALKEQLNQITHGYYVLQKAYFELLKIVRPLERIDELVRDKLIYHHNLFSIRANLRSVDGKRVNGKNAPDGT